MAYFALSFNLKLDDVAVLNMLVESLIIINTIKAGETLNIGLLTFILTLVYPTPITLTRIIALISV